MNFKLERFFHLTISLILGAFFFAIGAFSLSLPWMDSLQAAAILLLTEHSLLLSSFGLGFTLIGLSLIVYAISNAKRRYASIKVGRYAVSLDKNLLEGYVESYWQHSFPEQTIPFHLKIRKRSLQIVADFPLTPDSEQPLLLERVKSDFADLFNRVLGYPHDVHVVAHFPKEMSNS